MNYLPLFSLFSRARRFSMIQCWTAVIFAAVLLPLEAKTASPNIILILADDLGWTDLGCYGNRFNETPNIDRLAKQGMRFTDFHSAGAVCSPTRASLMAGQYPARVGITAHIPGHWRPFEKLAEPPNRLNLPDETVTIAERLQQTGYTTGYFGKWHLNWQQEGPGRHGFKAVISQTGHTVAKEHRKSGSQNGQRACDFLAENAVQFVRENRNSPFFMVVSPSAVHVPINTTPELQKKYEAKPKVAGYSCHPAYAGLLEELDDVVGRVMKALDELGLAKNTLLVFTSDNGGLEKEVGGMPGTLNRPLRDEKGTLYEGGIRVPLVARWPKVIAPDGVAPCLSGSIDLYPTFLEAAKIGLSRNRASHFQKIDGVSLMPILKKPSSNLKRDTFFWHYPHYHHSRPAGAIRQGDWKLIEFFDTGEMELFNLQSDLSESKNLSEQMPDKARDLQAMLQAWRRDVDAQMPQLNPAYDPKRVKEWWNRAKVETTEAPGTLR